MPWSRQATRGIIMLSHGKYTISFYRWPLGDTEAFSRYLNNVHFATTPRLLCEDTSHQAPLTPASSLPFFISFLVNSTSNILLLLTFPFNPSSSRSKYNAHVSGFSFTARNPSHPSNVILRSILVQFQGPTTWSPTSILFPYFTSLVSLST